MRYESLYLQVKSLNPEIGVEGLGVDLQPGSTYNWGKNGTYRMPHSSMPNTRSCKKSAINSLAVQQRILDTVVLLIATAL